MTYNLWLKFMVLDSAFTNYNLPFHLTLYSIHKLSSEKSIRPQWQHQLVKKKTQSCSWRGSAAATLTLTASDWCSRAGTWAAMDAVPVHQTWWLRKHVPVQMPCTVCVLPQWHQKKHATTTDNQKVGSGEGPQGQHRRRWTENEQKEILPSHASLALCPVQISLGQMRTQAQHKRSALSVSTVVNGWH